MKCEICGKDSTGKTCSGSCRAKLSRQSARSAAHAEEAHAPSARTIIDAVGKAHAIDYEGRRRNYAILLAWSQGEGSTAQQVLGRLALSYNGRIDMNSYLGLTG